MTINEIARKLLKIGRCDNCHKFSLRLIGIFLIPWKRNGDWKFIMVCNSCAEEIAPEENKN